MCRKNIPQKRTVEGKQMKRSNKNSLIAMATGLGALLVAKTAIRRWQEYSLRGKTVLITGGSRGLGLILARELVREGAHVAICARDAAELERARADLSARGAAPLTVVCDVTDQSQVEQMIRSVYNRFSTIDVLINNAGIIEVGPLEVMTIKDFEEAMKIHFWAPLYTTLAVLPDMRRRGRGRIVNISSIGGKLSVPHLLPYNTSKFALVGFSEGLRAELAKDGIVVTTVCPGLMRTGSVVHAMFKGQRQAEYTWFSVSGTLPIFAMSAERAARKIISACKRGDAEIVLSIQAKVADKFHALFPELTANLLGLVNRLLPEPHSQGIEPTKGKDLLDGLPLPWLTVLGERAAQKNNEIV